MPLRADLPFVVKLLYKSGSLETERFGTEADARAHAEKAYFEVGGGAVRVLVSAPSRVIWSETKSAEQPKGTPDTKSADGVVVDNVSGPGASMEHDRPEPPSKRRSFFRLP